MRIAPALPLLLAALLIAGCPGTQTPGAPCAPLDADEPAPDALTPGAMLLARSEDGGSADLFIPSGAAPAGTTLTTGENEAAMPDGGPLRWRLPVEADAAADGFPLTFTLPDLSQWETRVRVPDAATLAACALSAATPTGALPNDIVVGRCEPMATSFIVASADATLAASGLDGPGEQTAFFAPGPLFGASPFAAATMGDRTGAPVAVTLRGTAEVALVAPCAGTVMWRGAPVDNAGAPVRVAVSPPVTLRMPHDIDGDGTTDHLVETMPLIAPQGVAASAQGVFVTFTNIIEAASNDAPQQVGPGTVVRFVLDDERLRYDGHAVLPLTNPQAIAWADADHTRLAIAASGTLGAQSDGFAPVTPAGLCTLPANFGDGDEPRCTTLTDAVPAEPVLIGDALVTGDLISATLHVYDAETLVHRRDLEVGDAGLDAVFAVFPLAQGLFGALQFNDDTLVVFETRALSAPLLFDAFDDGDVGHPVLRVPLRPTGTSLLRGPIAAAQTSTGDVDIVFSLSAEARRVHLDALLGLQ